MTLEELYKGKGTIIKGNLYLPTKEYIEPFVNKLSKITNNFIIKAKTPDQITINNNHKDITYNRVSIQAVLSEEDGYSEVIGLIYGLDVVKPVYKIYRGFIDSESNLIVFQEEFLTLQQIIPEVELNLSPIDNLLQQTNTTKIILKKIKEQIFDIDDKVKSFGEWLDFSIQSSYIHDFGKVKIANSIIIDGYKELFINEDSKDFIKSNCSIYDIYKCFIKLIESDKDIMNKFEKTILISKMLNIIN